jgi:hypothetical protein
MTQKSNLQLAFDFPSCGQKVVSKDQCEISDLSNSVLSFGAFRAKKVAAESAQHFADILNMVSHIK